MALISISGFTSNVLESSNGILVEFEGYLTVSPVISNVVTRRPVEDGFNLNDAVHNNPTILAVEIIITDTAQTIFDKRSISNLPNILGTKFFQTHTKRQLNNIQSISDNRESISLKTKYNEFRGYLIENVSYTETDEQGLRITFSLVESREDITFQASANFDDSIGLWS